MKQRLLRFMVCAVMAATAFSSSAEPLTLKAAKDTFGRSNSRNRNSGRNATLYVAHAPNVRAIVAFDLSGVTNEILGATFRFQQQNTMPDAVVLTVAPMVQTEHNADWTEGAGALGTKGQNARPGESCYGWSAFPDVQWETASGQAVTDLADSQLWGTPLMDRKTLNWQEGVWVEVKVEDLRILETIRNSKTPLVTFGLWGTGGNGLYAISSKESGNAPELVLTLEAKKGDQK